MDWWKFTKPLHPRWQNIKAHGAAQELAVFDSWLAGVPSWLGKKATLDSATCALVLHLLGKANNDAQLVSTSRILYVQSLGALQRALVHPREWKTTETLGAAMFLCVFEVRISPFPSCSGPGEKVSAWLTRSVIAVFGYDGAEQLGRTRERSREAHGGARAGGACGRPGRRVLPFLPRHHSKSTPLRTSGRLAASTLSPSAISVQQGIAELG